jgi:hypothetical protein
MRHNMFLFTCFKWHNKSRVMFSQNRSYMWCITISFKRGGNIKGPHSTFGVDSWIFDASKGCRVEPSEGTSKLVEFTFTFQTFWTFIDLMILCSDQAKSLSFNLRHKRQIIQKKMICARSSSVSQLLKPTFERQIFLLGIATTFLCLSRMKFVALWTLPRHF